MTHRVPESETPLDLLHRHLHARKVLLHERQRVLLGLLYGVRTDIGFRNGVPEMERGGVEVGLSEDAEAGIHLSLERETYVAQYTQSRGWTAY